MCNSSARSKLTSLLHSKKAIDVRGLALHDGHELQKTELQHIMFMLVHMHICSVCTYER